MANLIEAFQNTVAFFFAMRIVVLIVMIAVFARIVYQLYHTWQVKKTWNGRKKH